MTPYRNVMSPFLNFHAHRVSVSPSETVIRNLIVPQDSAAFPITTGKGLFSAGIHPWFIPNDPEPALNTLEHLASMPTCIAIGEIGLDRHAVTDSVVQRALFLRQADIAVRHRLPMVIHCVKAWEELFAIRKEIPSGTPCIIHGFRGKPPLATDLLRKGFYLSFGFRLNPQSLQSCPPDRLFLETDEDPRNVEALYRTAARWRGCHAEEIKQRCWKNLERITRRP
ncbi:MAG: TatD family hydrolase [Paraprevotella sp.]|nr:TatD family hydrolase [Paraprevotella sp.]